MPLVVARVPEYRVSTASKQYAEYCVVLGGHGQHKGEKWVRWSTFKTLMCELERTPVGKHLSKHPAFAQVHAWRLGDRALEASWLAERAAAMEALLTLLITSFGKEEASLPEALRSFLPTLAPLPAQQTDTVDATHTHSRANGHNSETGQRAAPWVLCLLAFLLALSLSTSSSPAPVVTPVAAPASQQTLHAIAPSGPPPDLSMLLHTHAAALAASVWHAVHGWAAHAWSCARSSARAASEAAKVAAAKGAQAAARGSETAKAVAARSSAAVIKGSAAAAAATQQAAVATAAAATVAAMKGAQATMVAAARGAEAAKLAAVRSGKVAASAAQQSAEVTSKVTVAGGRLAVAKGKATAVAARKGSLALLEAADLAGHIVCSRVSAAAGVASRGVEAVHGAWQQELRKQCPCHGCKCD